MLAAGRLDESARSGVQRADKASNHPRQSTAPATASPDPRCGGHRGAGAYGDPDRRLVEAAHRGGALAGWQVGSPEEASAADHGTPGRSSDGRPLIPRRSSLRTSGAHPLLLLSRRNEIGHKSFYERRPRSAISRRPADGDATVKGILGLVTGCSLVMAALALTASPARAQTPPEVTITFKLTVNGTPLKGDGFAVQWGETGLELCNAPCAGSGHTYVQPMNFPAGATETFVFIRGSGRVTPGHPGQLFGKQTLTAKNDRTVSAFFTYGTAAIATPSTGSAPPVAYGGTIAGAGAALMLLSLWRRGRGGNGHKPSVIHRNARQPMA
jgi:hypothetical protein